MRPLCQYGFPCIHMMYDEDGDDICVHPFTNIEPPKTKRDWDKTSDTLLSDAIYYDCPINKDIKISNQIEKMLDNLCWSCEGAGRIWGPLDEDGELTELICPDCEGDGLKSASQARREAEMADAVRRREKEKDEIRERIYTAFGITDVFRYNPNGKNTDASRNDAQFNRYILGDNKEESK